MLKANVLCCGNKVGKGDRRGPWGAGGDRPRAEQPPPESHRTRVKPPDGFSWGSVTWAPST